MTFSPFYFSPLHQFGLIQSTSVYFNSIRFICSIVVQFGPLDQFSPLWSIWSNLIHMVHLRLFSPIWSIRSTSIYLVHFRSLWSTSMYLLKNGKIQVCIESTINYLSNINYNYMISFGYHNILLKKMRIWIITLKLKNFNCTKRN